MAIAPHHVQSAALHIAEALHNALLQKGTVHCFAGLHASLHGRHSKQQRQTRLISTMTATKIDTRASWSSTSPLVRCIDTMSAHTAVPVHTYSPGWSCLRLANLIFVRASHCMQRWYAAEQPATSLQPARLKTPAAFDSGIGRIVYVRMSGIIARVPMNRSTDRPEML